MIQTGFETRIKVQNIVSSQLPDFILDESPKTVDFLKQYYISQEYQGGTIDLTENLDQYLNFDNLTPEVIVDSTSISAAVSSTDTTIGIVGSTKGFPKEYGLLKINDEIITYTGITTNSFTGCIRGFSGITSYAHDINREELVFTSSSASEHNNGSSVQNLSSLFLKEFYKKFKYTFSPGLENSSFTPNLNVGNFLREIKSFYRSKGTDESFRILFNVLFGEIPSIINLEEKLVKPSFAEYNRREIAVAKIVSGNAENLKGQVLLKEGSNINASISEIVPFLYNNEKYFKVSLFVGYDEDSDIQGRFVSVPNTKVTEKVNLNDTVISVDSTIGFSTSGIIRSGINSITYTDKTVNQFLNCSNISNIINQEDLIYSSDVYYAYENGDTSKKVELVFSSVISKFVQEGIVIVEQGDPISIKNLGDKVINPDQNKTSKEVLANSWIYNTSSSFYIENASSSTFNLFAPVDKSSLKIGDAVQVVERDTNNVIFPQNDGVPPYVNIDESIDRQNEIIISGDYSAEVLNEKFDYNLRRVLSKAEVGSNSNISIQYGNNNLISDVQNVYFDDQYAYVASNSLPSGTRGKGLPFTEDITIKTKRVSINLSDNTSGILTSYNENTGKYSVIQLMGSNTPSVFRTGEKIFYQPQGASIVGLETGNYYVEVFGDSKEKIRLYNSNYLIGSSNYLTFSQALSGDDDHIFILDSQKSNIVGPQKLLKKFPINPSIENGSSEETKPGGVGLLVNGVEISNYKSLDKVYYGPLEKITVLNGGEGFDVINPPKVEISSGIGSTALVNPVVSGSVVDVYVDFDSYNYNIDKLISVDVTGGNGTGCVLKPLITNTFREVRFDGRTTTSGGGINTSTNQIIFDEPHGFVDGQQIIYDSNLNSGIGINSIRDGSTKLINKSTYVVNKSNNIAIQLHENFDDYRNGINTIEFTGDSNSGIHKMKVGPLNVLKDIVVINGGKNYTNKKLIVEPSGISTSNDWIYSENHGFSTGEIVEYSTTGTSITELFTSNSYYILKVDSDRFRLCDAGIGGTIFTNYEREKYVQFRSSPGEGYQQFSYPQIRANINAITAGIGQTTITITPVVKGSIKDIQIYNKGAGYGSSIINYNKSPIITVKTGKFARVKPIIINGRITSVNVENGGEEYYSTPDLVITDSSGKGSGAVLRAVISNQRLDSVQVIKAGIGYSSSDTTISVVSSGKNQVFDSEVRSLTIVNNEIFDSNRLLLDTKENNLKYSICGYTLDLLLEEEDKISGIIGWAYDGNPIYGPFGSKDPNSFTTSELLISGYEKNSTYIKDRPSISDFKEGFFVEDYRYTGVGDLDEHNGRYERNKEFPNGVYAYHATVGDSNTENRPTFPYFIGNTFRSNIIKENYQINFDQSYDFNNSNLKRNTFPYKISEEYGRNDFIDEKDGQEIVIDSISSGSIQNISIVSAGSSFKVGDKLNFDNTNTDGSGLNAKVSSIKGETINTIETSEEIYENSTLTWNGNFVSVITNTEHDFKSNDYVALSGISTDSLKPIEKYHRINVVDTSISRTISSISSGAATTEIYVSTIPNFVSAGSTIGIGTETLTVLNIFENKNILRIQREYSDISHNESSIVQYNTKNFTLDENLPFFESNPNKKVYFNASESVGIGSTTGTGFTTSFTFGNSNITRQIPTKGIYLENHPFKTNQKIKLTTGSGGGDIRYSVDPGGTANLLPTNLFAVSKSKDVIGIKTGIGSSEVYFVDINGGNGGDKDTYLFETTFTPVTATVKRIEATVSVSTSHGLLNNDQIDLKIVPNISVGIGTSTSVSVIRSARTNHLYLKRISFSSDANSDQITSTNHGLKTGDRVRYEVGAFSNSYYVYKVDDDIIKLTHSYIDAISSSPKFVGITSSSSGTLSLINPEIKVTKNNNLVFDLSDSSLSGHEFKIYYDKEFKNEFVSTGKTDSLSISGIGTIGVSTNASLTISGDNNIPKELFYNLEKSGYISTADIDVKNYSRILFTDSLYNGSYKVSGVGDTTFKIYLNNSPEKNSYNQSECDSLVYSTTSKNAIGKIDDINIISGGFEYKKLPSYVGSSSTIAKNALVIPSSNEIGNINEIEIVTDNYIYPTDKTLEPQALLPTLIEVSNSNTFDSVIVDNSGSNYYSSPDLIIIDSVTNTKINSGFLEPVFETSSISRVNVLEKPQGISDNNAIIRAINNNNGFTIDQVESNAGTAFTCRLITPVNGFGAAPFLPNDKVYIEGIRKIGSDGDGFNSENYGYQLLNVSSIDNADPFKVTFDLVGLTTNTGIAITNTDGYGRLIHENDYPSFTIVLKSADFDIGENLSINGVEKDLKVIKKSSGKIVIFGKDVPLVNQTIRGNSSLTEGTVVKVTENTGNFEVDYSYEKNFGWDNSTGMLSLDHQFISDNDYYQNLSYSVKSSQTWKDIKSPVNRLVHTSGLKNFSDTQISDTAPIIGIGSSDKTLIINDVFDEQRVDVIRGIDSARDVDNLSDISNFLEFKNTRFVDYIDCKTNNVITIDNINKQFSNLESDPDLFLNIDNISTLEQYETYLVRINSNGNTSNQVQLSEFVLLSNGNDQTLFNKSELINSGIGYTTFSEDTFGNYFIQETDVSTHLRFVPNNPYDIDYDLKYIKTDVFPISGIGTTTFGFINLTSSNKSISSGTASTIFSSSVDEIKSLLITSKVTNTATKQINYVETYVTHDGTDAQFSEYFVDTGNSLSNRIGISTATISNGNIIFKYENDTSDSISVNSKIVGFGTTSLGNGGYRYLAPIQSPGDERSARYEAVYRVGVGTTTVFTGSSTLYDAIKCNVEVSIGSSTVLHQITAIHDGDNAYLQQSQFLSNTPDSENEYSVGMGTFGAVYTSSDFTINFHPEDTVGIATLKAFNQVFYKEIDLNNEPTNLSYGNINETVNLKLYNAINGNRINKTQFDLKHNNIDIFKKSFNPSSVIVPSSSGIAYTTFNIVDHYFRTGEELKYTPKSTFVGVGSTPMTYDDGTNTGILTSNVFAIRIDDDNFGIATTKSKANLGLGVTITSFGEGNFHTLEMLKSNEKALISIDGIVQYPLTDTRLTHTLQNNGSVGIGTTQSIFSLSGISSVTVLNILKIDDEFMRVDNVGIGTSSLGPITPGIGTFNLVSVKRGSVGSSSTNHSEGSTVKFFKGNYNILDSKVNFIEAPRGNPQGEDENGIPFSRSTFTGRAYLRNNYQSNFIYDDISNQFTGITSEFILTVGGANTTGIGTSGGNGLLFINGIFQTPETDNNPNQNYQIIEDETAGITTVKFTGMYVGAASTDYIDEVDVNVNQLPRGGVPVTIGSSIGLGYAPLVGANIRPIVSDAGSITGVVGIATTGCAVSISTALYNNVTGILSVTTTTDHNLVLNQNNDEVRLVGLEFTCNSGPGIVTYPTGGEREYSVVRIINSTTFEVNAGISTLIHYYVGGPGTATPYYGDLNFGSGYNDIVGISVTVYKSGHSGNIATITASPVGFNTYNFVSATSGGISSAGSLLSITPQLPDDEVTYNPQTGILSVTMSSEHGFSNGTLIDIADESLTFTCAQDNYSTQHKYPRSSDPISGISTAITVIDSNTFTAYVGTAPAHSGGRLQFTIENGGSGYTKCSPPEIFVSEPSYENLRVNTISRRNGTITGAGIGTGLLLDVKVGPSNDFSGIGSELFEISEFNINRYGYSFLPGDKVEPVGLVTSRKLKTLISRFELEVVDTFNDNFALWQFGELDYIDSIQSLQNGVRTRFPLKYNNETISIESNDNFEVDLNPILLIFVNRVIQQPGESYEFIGGTSIKFAVAPEPDDDIHIFFYKGTDGEDSVKADADEKPIELGDEVQLVGQENRSVSRFTLSDRIRTNPYTEIGITEDFKPISVFKQKYDRVIDGTVISKTRESLESRIFPTAKIISDVDTTDNKIFIDNASGFFDYENESDNGGNDLSISAIIISGKDDPVAAAITATVSSTGTITSLIIEDGGSGYDPNATAPVLKIGNPFNSITGAGTDNDPFIVSYGTTATATVTVSSSGTINGTSITNPGSGYTQTEPPNVILTLPSFNQEIITGISTVSGNSGIIAGIGTTVSGSQLAIKFTGISTESFDMSIFVPGNPIYIFDTEIGIGVTSVDGGDSNIVGIGTTCLNNIYVISEFSQSGVVSPFTGIITCQIDSGTDINNIPESVGYTTDPIGRFSVGIVTGIRNSSPISIGVTGFTINSGLSSFPTLQRRSFIKVAL